jgi:hypothetical protein
VVSTSAWEIGEFLDDKVLRKRLEFHAWINEGEGLVMFSCERWEDLSTAAMAD